VPVTDAAVSRPSARVSAASQPAGALPAGTPLSFRPRRRRRIAAAAALSATAALLLSACGDSRPGTAAVVGDHRITDGDLQSLVDESLSAPGVRAALPNSDYRGDIGAYRRAVLNVEVERLLAEDGARRLGITVDENAVDARYKSFEDQSGGPDSFASELASRLAVSPSLYRQLVRTEVLESEIGYTEGKVKRPTDAQLQALYQQYLPTATSATLSLIQVPSQAIADQAAAQLKSDPSKFAAVAAQYAGSGSQTSPQPAKYPVNRLPPDLVSALQKTPKNEIFPYSLANGGAKAYFVIRFGGIETPSLEEARPQLEAQTLQQAAAAGQKYLQGVAGDVGVDVNPRYGTWKQDQLAITDFVNPVIKPTPSPAPSPGGTLPGDAGTGGGTSGGAGTQPAPTPSG
jgi:parvulin-like peptidyl-prolyl isomerase